MKAIKRPAYTYTLEDLTEDQIFLIRDLLYWLSFQSVPEGEEIYDHINNILDADTTNMRDSLRYFVDNGTIIKY